MSRQTSYSDSLEVLPSGYTGLSNLTTTSSYPITNAYADTDSTTYARLSLSTSSTGYLYLTFDVNLPAGATVTGVTAQCRVRVSSTSRVTSTVCQMYVGTTAKGSNTTFASTSSTNVVTLSTGSSWNASDMSDLRMRIGGTGSSSSQSKYIYLYGATVTISYSVDATEYEITVTNGTSASVTYDQWILAGEDATIGADDLTGITVTDNGTDVTSQFAQGLTDSISKVPESGVDTSFTDSGGAFYISSSSTSTQYLEYACGHSAEDPGTETSTNTYVKGSASGNTTTGDCIYSFDFSEIPVGATITSVSVRAYVAREDATVDSTHVCRVSVYSGSTLKGAADDVSGTSFHVHTLSSVGTWTRAELQQARFHLTLGYYGGRIAGISWDVSYEVDGYAYTISNVTADHAIVFAYASTGPTMYVKSNGSWVSVTKAYVKANGSWRQVDLDQAFDSSKRYVRG